MDFVVRLDVPKAGMLIEVSPEGVSGMIQRFVSSADEAASFDEVVSIVKSWGGEILINGMDFEAFEGINGSDSMLPDISNDIIKASIFKHVDRVG